MEKNAFDKLTRKRVVTENGNITYWVRHRPDPRGPARPLVFLHGLTADHTLFEPQIAFFADRYDMLCWDAPAHGASRPWTRFSYRGAAEQLKAILEKERFQKPVLVGQSMGGYIIQTLLKYHPDIAAGFVGIDTTPFGTSYYSRSDRWWLRQISWMARCFPYRTLVRSIADSCACTRPARGNMRAALRQYPKDELCHLLGIGYSEFLAENCDLAIDIPVLILVGEKDTTGKVRRYCKAWHETAGFPLRVIANAAHNSNFDNPAQVNAEIEGFAAALP